MTLDEVVKYYGSQAKAAKAIGRTRQACSFWRRVKRIPIKAQLMFEVQSSGALKADGADVFFRSQKL